MLGFMLAGLCSFAEVKEQASHTFTSVAAGISITKPEHWRFKSTAPLAASATSRLSDQALMSALRHRGKEPLVVLLKYPEPHDFNPSVRIMLRPLGTLRGRSAEDILKLLQPFFRRQFRDFSLVGEFEPITLSGVSGAQMVMDYTLPSAHGQGYQARSRMICLLRGEFMIQIGVGLPRDADKALLDDIEHILNALVLGR